MSRALAEPKGSSRTVTEPCEADFPDRLTVAPSLRPGSKKYTGTSVSELSPCSLN